MNVEPNNAIDSEFINIFVHDLKTPLSAIKSYLDLIEQIGGLSDQQVRFIERAMVGIERMENIVHNFLDISRLDSDVPLERAPFDLRKIIEDSVDLMSAEMMKKKIEMHTDIDPRLEDVLGDEKLFTHVVQNVIGNAIKYNKPEGKIWVTVNDERAYARVDVQDTGIGIAEDDLNKIFERFYRGKTGDASIRGNGLGLAIARLIVEKHGGHIWVTSDLKHGSTFSFTIPRDSHHGMGSNISDSSIRTALRGFSILHHESAAESLDDVDDNTQEPSERGEDSPRDEYEP